MFKVYCLLRIFKVENTELRWHRGSTFDGEIRIMINPC